MPIEPVPLVNFVLQLLDAKDLGPLALLRGGLVENPTRQMRAWPLLARFGGIPAEDTHRAEVVRTVAGLMASKGLQHAPKGTSFGKACAELLSEEERRTLGRPEKSGPVARRVQHLLAASRGEICARVSSLGRRLATEGAGRGYQGVSLDFGRLYQDLRNWPGRARACWAADFWDVAEVPGEVAP